MATTTKVDVSVAEEYEGRGAQQLRGDELRGDARERLPNSPNYEQVRCAT